MKPFERFAAWRLCHRLVLEVYRATAGWPRAETYGLTAQIRQAAASSATNIAEGSARRGNRELRRFLDISLGSLSEVAYLLRLARGLEYLSVAEFDELDRMCDEAGKATWGLHPAVSRRGQKA